jgi:uncharacterized membrane protein YgcG
MAQQKNQLSEFIELIDRTHDLQDQLEAGADFVELGRENGYAFTLADLERLGQQRIRELPLDLLKGVSAAGKGDDGGSSSGGSSGSSGSGSSSSGGKGGSSGSGGKKKGWRRFLKKYMGK